jgi:hypothetical protein
MVKIKQSIREFRYQLYDSDSMTYFFPKVKSFYLFLINMQKVLDKPFLLVYTVFYIKNVYKDEERMVTRTYTRQVNKTKSDSPKAHWSEKQKLQAVTNYLVVGHWGIVSDTTGIPIDTLKKWKQQDWWKQFEEEVRRSSNLELGGKLSKVREKAIAVVLDRLEHGDLKVNPETGKFSRIPVNAKNASEIMMKTIDRELLLQKMEEKPILAEEHFLDRLKSIEEHLKAGARKKLDIIDVTPISAELPHSEVSNAVE